MKNLNKGHESEREAGNDLNYSLQISLKIKLKKQRQ